MICVLFLFCSMVLNQQTAPTHERQVAQFLPNVFIAHNYLDGRFFSEIEIGDEILYKDPEDILYKVVDVIELEATPHDSLTPLLGGHSIEWIYENIYSKDLVLQTCIYKDDLWSWGRLFIIAEKQ